MNVIYKNMTCFIVSSWWTKKWFHDMNATAPWMPQSFFSRSLSSGVREGPADHNSSTIEVFVNHLKSQRSKIWNSLQLLEMYCELSGKPIKRSNLIWSICDIDNDLIVLSSPGNRSLIFFRDNNEATLKMAKDDDDNDNIEAALNTVAKQIKKDCSEIDYQHDTYSTIHQTLSYSSWKNSHLLKMHSHHFSSATLLQVS